MASCSVLFHDLQDAQQEASELLWFLSWRLMESLPSSRQAQGLSGLSHEEARQCWACRVLPGMI